ncbi:MAG: M15 family metallopeptidase [Saprospiraceae bacterium]|nr:M15 family metallopeptidase [Saprospiraceae bacterium]
MQERKNWDLLNKLHKVCVFSFSLLATPLLAQNNFLDSIDKHIAQSTFEFLSKDHIHGKFNPDTSIEFSKIDSQYCYKDTYLISEVYEAFIRMANAAESDSVILKILSGTRNFEHQKSLWENKWCGKTKVNGKKLNILYKDHFSRANKILEYTAPPGFSRHHWGTEIDINSVDVEYFETEEGIKVYSWLLKNAEKFGFCQTYTHKDLRNNKGFNEEKWHWSYSKLSEPILNEVIRTFNKLNISDFSGFQAVRRIDLLDDYILSINRCH